MGIKIWLHRAWLQMPQMRVHQSDAAEAGNAGNSRSHRARQGRRGAVGVHDAAIRHLVAAHLNAERGFDLGSRAGNIQQSSSRRCSSDGQALSAGERRHGGVIFRRRPKPRREVRRRKEMMEQRVAGRVLPPQQVGKLTGVPQGQDKPSFYRRGGVQASQKACLMQPGRR